MSRDCCQTLPPGWYFGKLPGSRGRVPPSAEMNALARMDITIRQMGAADLAVWAQLRCELWPGDSLENHQTDIDYFLRRGNFWGLIAQLPDNHAAGFAEIAIREYANGCVSRPVAFLEGIWVRPEFRRQRIGARLLETAEEILTAHGFRELGSDAEVENQGSHRAHSSWGFAETERVVCFRKELQAAGSVRSPGISESQRKLEERDRPSIKGT